MTEAAKTCQGFILACAIGLFMWIAIVVLFLVVQGNGIP